MIDYMKTNMEPMQSHQALLSALLVLTLALPTSLLASDHIDGPVSIDNPAADILLGNP